MSRKQLQGFNIVVHLVYLVGRSIKTFIQCASLDSTSFIFYPEIKATEVKALKVKTLPL